MRNLTKSAGEMLRTLRRRRNMTLEQAARLLHTSPPVLSRKERGAAALERIDIQAAISAYGLDPWESYQLMTTAGFLPGSFARTDTGGGVRHFAETALTDLTFPAFITDELAYLRAWNHPIHMIWSPVVDGKPKHLLDDLFTQRVRELMRDQWQAYTERALRIFQLRTLNIRPRTDYVRLLQSLERKHGPEFAKIWEAADVITQETVGGIGASSGIETVIVRHDGPTGPIDYLVSEGTRHFPQPFELTIYVPYGAENVMRYEHFRATMGANQIYFAGEPL